eukprot:TRINITY_DN17405_c0_g1_i2.p1 TRINITY_DN17405_c0_g1~~TRINITY_DN17405_c0_g1_i2.p1  ORF type:complete len:590 (-),score=103.22 TRINITY_DN17405_c0_g1_i2:345-1853(-)
MAAKIHTEVTVDQLVEDMHDHQDRTAQLAGDAEALPNETPEDEDMVIEYPRKLRRTSEVIRNHLEQYDYEEFYQADIDVRKKAFNCLFHLDIISAAVIMLNALVIGVSADFETEHVAWKVLEILFTLFFAAELFIKLKILGCREVMCGSSAAWNYFDVFCLSTAAIDLGVTYGFALISPGSSSDLGGFLLIKILRLARLGRLIRLLRFKIFSELKRMIHGVFAGLRVLLWAVVLLVFCIFMLAIVARFMIIDDELPEFSTVPNAMFTLFRCYTDGCAAYDGTPLPERVRGKFGDLFMIIYVLVFLFVTVGIFNLIMAVFIDNVVSSHVKTRQAQLGAQSAEMQDKIVRALGSLAAQSDWDSIEAVSRTFVEKLRTSISKLRSNPADEQPVDNTHPEIPDDMEITKEVFNKWIKSEEMLGLLEDVGIEVATRYELFDVLDADLSGVLNLQELVEGLMRLRGPVSKNDMVAVRLKVEYLTHVIVDMSHKVNRLSRQHPDEEGNG